MNGSLLADASRQLMNRPADEHFASFADLRNAANVRKTLGVETLVTPEQILFQATTDGRVVLGFTHRADEFTMNQLTASQLAGLAGANPSFVFERLTAKTAAQALNEGIRRRSIGTDRPAGEVERFKLLTQGDRLRAVTTDSYSRVWEADLLAEVDRWIIPHGFKPAMPTKNTDSQGNNIMGNNKPALFSGERDSFAFFMAEQQGGDYGDGGRPIRKGVFFYNSEVGCRSFGQADFVFDDMCANFLIWGARAIKRLRIVHRSKEGRDILRRFRERLRECMPTLAQTELAMLRTAAEVAFATTGPNAVERLVKQFQQSQKQAESILEASFYGENRGIGELTHASIAAGASSLAKDERTADATVELATLAGDIIVAAGGR